MATTRSLSCSTSKDADGNDLSEAREAEFTLNEVPESMEEAVEMYGEETVQDLFWRQFDVKAQGAARSLLKRGFSSERIEKEMSKWRPDVTRRTSGGPDRSLEDQFEDLDTDAQEELLEKLASKAQQKRQTGEPTA